MGRLFGTDGVRGVANKELTSELAFKLGQAGAYVLSGGGSKRAKILIGKDTRKSSDMLEAAIVAGVCSVGADAIVIGTAPTPAIAYITRTRGYDAGIVISASHNPFEFNGIKFFSSQGYKLNDDIEAEIENIILDGKPEMTLPVGEGLGNVTYDFDAKREYMDFAKSTIDVDFKGMTIAIDCANGASSVTSEYVLRELGADVRVINNKPDGININTNCGSTHIEGLCEFVKSEKADIGLAFDGDADRVLAVDENGVLVDGDKIMTICGLFMRDEGKLKKDTIVATVMSNLGFFIMAEKNNLNTAQTKVGDRYVLEEMLDKGYSLGGEQSGHIIFLDHNTTGDGLVTALQLVQAVKKQGKKLSELASLMTILPQVLINAKVKTENKNSYMDDAEIKAEIDALDATFAGEGRVLIRPSGTEPLVRVMIEGKDIEFITEKAKKLAELIEKKLG